MSVYCYVEAKARIFILILIQTSLNFELSWDGIEETSIATISLTITQIRLLVMPIQLIPSLYSVLPGQLLSANQNHHWVGIVWRDFSYAKQLQPTANLVKIPLSTPEHTLNSGDEGSKEFSLAISLSMTWPIPRGCPLWQWNAARPTPFLPHCSGFLRVRLLHLFWHHLGRKWKWRNSSKFPESLSACQHGHSITMWHAQTGYPNDMCSVSLFHLLHKARWFFPHRPCSREARCYCLEWTPIMESRPPSLWGHPETGWSVSAFHPVQIWNKGLKEGNTMNMFQASCLRTQTFCKAELTWLVCVCVKTPSDMVRLAHFQLDFWTQFPIWTCNFGPDDLQKDRFFPTDARV